MLGERAKAGLRQDEREFVRGDHVDLSKTGEIDGFITPQKNWLKTALEENLIVKYDTHEIPKLFKSAINDIAA